MKIKAFSYYTLFYFVTRASFIGCGNDFIIQTAKGNLFFSCLMSIILSILPLLLFFYLQNKYPNKSIFEINKHVFKKFGNLINFIYISSLLALGCLLFANLVDFTNSQLLYETPSLVLILLFAGIIIYTTYDSIKTLSRLSVILFYISISFLILTFIGLIPQIDTANYLPLKLSGSFGTGFLFMLFFSSPCFLMLDIPISIVENYSIKKNIFMIILAFITVWLIIYIIVGNYGNNLSLIISYPEFQVLKRLAVSNFVERIEDIFASIYIFDIFIFLCLLVRSLNKFIPFNIIIIAVIAFFINQMHFHIMYPLFISFIFVPLLIFIKKRPKPFIS